MWLLPTAFFLSNATLADIPPPSEALEIVDARVATFQPGRARVRSGLPPSTRVAIVLGESLDLENGCGNVLAGVCVAATDLHRVIEGRLTASGALTLSIPQAPGDIRSTHVEAIAIEPDGTTHRSNIVRVTIDQFYEDTDNDGLANAREIELGSDPYRRDSDGGGIEDDQELLIDGTDPNDPTDDRPGERICHDGTDDDGDGLVDCDDVRDCLETPACRELDCDDGRDNNHNGLVDCEDLSCLGSRECSETSCEDGLDNDADGLADCDDEDCWSRACHDEVLAWVDGGTAQLYRTFPTWAYSYARSSVRPIAVSGKVFVSGPRAPNGQICNWTRSYGDLNNHPLGGDGVYIEAGCELGRDALPEWDELLGPSHSRTTRGNPRPRRRRVVPRRLHAAKQ